MLSPGSLELGVLWLVNQIYFFIVTWSHDNNIDTYHARLDWICFSWYSKSAKTMLYKFRKSEELEIQISQISQENTCVGVSFLRKLHTFWPATLLKRDSNTGAFCEIFKNTSFEEHLRTTTSKCWIIFPFKKAWNSKLQKSLSKNKYLFKSFFLFHVNHVNVFWGT